MRWAYIILGWLLTKVVNRTKKALSLYTNYYYNKMIKSESEVRYNGISKIFGFDSIKIGKNVHVGNNAFIKGEGGLEIADNTHISRNLVIYTHNHNYNGKRLPYDDTFTQKSVSIEKNVWIGTNVIILPGTTIGEGAIIGAGVVLSGNIKKGAIVVAPKQHLLKLRDMEHYEYLDENRQFGGINGK